MPQSITADNGSEFAGRAMDAWSYQYGVQLEFIRPGKPVDNSYIESFNGRLRDECLNVEAFFDLPDVREKLSRWRLDYNQVRPHSALADWSYPFRYPICKLVSAVVFGSSVNQTFFRPPFTSC
jgi:putative transposase